MKKTNKILFFLAIIIILLIVKGLAVYHFTEERKISLKNQKLIFIEEKEVYPKNQEFVKEEKIFLENHHAQFVVECYMKLELNLFYGTKMVISFIVQRS